MSMVLNRDDGLFIRGRGEYSPMNVSRWLVFTSDPEHNGIQVRPSGPCPVPSSAIYRVD